MRRRTPGALGPGDRGSTGGRRPPPQRIGPGCARPRRQGPHRPRPTGGIRLGHRAARRPLVRPPSPGPAARRQPGSAPAADRAREHLRLRAVPHLLAARCQLEPRPRAGPACWPSSSSCRASRWRPASGSARCFRPGSPTTTPDGSTNCAWPARWPGPGSPHARNASRRSTARAAPATRRGSSTPSPATPLAIVARQDLAWMLAAVRGEKAPTEPTAGASADLLAVLRQRGACFRSELAPASGRLSTEVDEGLWDLVARGIVTADAFSAVRSLLSARLRQRRSQGSHRGAARRAALGRQRASVGTGIGEGRWSLLPDADETGTGHAERTAGRGVGRGGGLAAPGPVGRRGMGALGTRVLPGPLAGRRAGPPPAGGPRAGTGRSLRRRRLRRAVRHARSRVAPRRSPRRNRPWGTRSWWPGPIPST